MTGPKREPLQAVADRCFGCDRGAVYSVRLVNCNGRIYLPNLSARGQSEEVMFCRECMRHIEENVRAAIAAARASAAGR